MKNESKLWLRANRHSSIKPDPQTRAFLAFKAALMKAGTTPHERKANAPAVRAAHAEAKSSLFSILFAEFQEGNAPEVADAAARKEALKVVNHWARLVLAEADNTPVTSNRTPPVAQTVSAPETPKTDALAALLEAKTGDQGRKRRFDIERCCIVCGTTTVHAANIEEAHVLAEKMPFSPEAVPLVFVTRTVGIDNQPVRLVHEDLSRMSVDHLTGGLVYCAADHDHPTAYDDD